MKNKRGMGPSIALPQIPRGAGLNPVASPPLTFDQEQETTMQIARQAAEKGAGDE